MRCADCPGSKIVRSASSSGSPSSTTGSYTLAQVKEHGSAGDCWTAINGKVYDLTSWENKHPGGASKIIALCGTDGTTAFLNQHGDKSKPNDALDGYQIGVLATPYRSSPSPNRDGRRGTAGHP